MFSGMRYPVCTRNLPHTIAVNCYSSVQELNRRLLRLRYEKSQAYWDCGDCQHRLSQGARPETRLTVGDSIAYYDLPLEIYREM